MLIIPAIDIIDGKCVRLVKGEFSTKKIYSSEPLAMAKEFELAGAQMVHVVDLDAAKSGMPVNQELILNLAKSLNVPIEVGGGIRTEEAARMYLSSGIKRIIIGTAAINNQTMISNLISEFGSSRIVIGVETKLGKIATHGWQETSDIDYLDFAKELKNLKVTEIIFTDVDKDGSLTEPNFAGVKQLIDLGFNVIASGGISDITAIKKLKKQGAAAAILGKAIYENKIQLTDALNAAKPESNLTKRIIPCLDVKYGQVVKGIGFKNHKIVGDIVELAKHYSEAGADELVFYDITASADGRTISPKWVKRVAEVINIPFCVAGGIRSVSNARAIIQNGADKISINSPALENPELINELAEVFGSQCVVVGIDSYQENGEYFVKQYTGDQAKMISTKWKTLDWAKAAEKRGAGEIVLNCMNQDGMRKGYDINQLKVLSDTLKIPVIASGGAGTEIDFKNLFFQTNVDGALAASVFHSGDIKIQDLKKYLTANNLQIRV